MVVNNDTYYWIYLSSDHPFQVYYEVRQEFLQSATSVIKKCDGVITKCDRCYKMRRLLQSAKEHGVHVHYLLHSIWFSMTFISENYALSYGHHDLILFSFLNYLFFPSIQDEAWNSYWIRDILSNLQLTRVLSRFFPVSIMSTSCNYDYRLRKAFKTESTRKLSNFNFQWIKTLYQNN